MATAAAAAGVASTQRAEGAPTRKACCCGGGHTHARTEQFLTFVLDVLCEAAARVAAWPVETQLLALLNI